MTAFSPNGSDAPPSSRLTPAVCGASMHRARHSRRPTSVRPRRQRRAWFRSIGIATSGWISRSPAGAGSGCSLRRATARSPMRRPLRREARALTADCFGVWAVDLEMDGDLDLVVGVSDEAPAALRNNGDGTWRVLPPLRRRRRSAGVRVGRPGWRRRCRRRAARRGGEGSCVRKPSGGAVSRDAGAGRPGRCDGIDCWRRQRRRRARSRDARWRRCRSPDVRASRRRRLRFDSRTAERQQTGCFRPSPGNRHRSPPGPIVLRRLAGMYRLFLADLDNNGALDVVASGAGRVRVWLADAHGNISTAGVGSRRRRVRRHRSQRRRPARSGRRCRWECRSG